MVEFHDVFSNFERSLGSATKNQTSHDETAHPNSSWKSLAISSQRIAVKSVGKMQNELKRLKPLAVAEHDEKYDL